MLSRIANNLFWMVRYLERALHTARYVNVHYFSTLDAPLLSRKEFVLDSISSMTGLAYEYEDKGEDLDDEELVYRITMDENNPVSIKTAIFCARENARGARDTISSELWESVNKFYHSVNAYNHTNLNHEQVLGYTDMVVDQCLIVQGYISHTLLHNDIWSLVQLGMSIEAAGQLTRILIAKAKDILRVENQNLGKPVETYQCITLLKSAEAFDMSRIFYKNVPNLTDTLEFLILNKDFPRSLIYNLEAVSTCLNKIKMIKGNEKGSPEFFAGKMNATFSYLTVEDIEEDILPFLEKTLDDVYKLGELIIRRLS